ncbi:hypothetical protein [Actinotalea sp. C106]|uniref:hypothetical protein n=1 Tax=Actinotalea sp. C106 TaxID=2908644 RepID=UPI002028B71B|nr:hypothetical protein [Actinotalea sp. C106]
MTRNRTTATRTTAAALAVAWALTGCTGDAPETPSSPEETAPPTDTATPTPEPTPTPTENDDSSPDGEPSDEVPDGFPDPESLIGQESYDEQTEDGWRTVVGGEPLDLPYLFGSCFEGGTEEVCAYSISVSAPMQADNTPAPADAALLLLLQATDDVAPDTPTWEVLDAIITRPPGDEPAILQGGEGEPGVAIYPAGDPGQAETVPVAAAWGPDDDIDELVEVHPDDVACEVVLP